MGMWMKSRKSRIAVLLMSAGLLFSAYMGGGIDRLTAYAAEKLSDAAALELPESGVYADVQLPDGSVAGLPEDVTVLDDAGKSVDSETGEFFYEVKDMVPGTTYTKTIQIMNLREDKAYHIYMYAEPVSKEGNIDLENECTETLTLEGSSVYEGKVTGIGSLANGSSTDMSKTPIDLGLYIPGQGRTMTCSVIWDGDTTYFRDFGARRVDVSGTTITREGNADKTFYGEVTFKWIFYAVVDDSYVPPKTGIDGATHMMEIIVIAAMAVVFVAIVVVAKKRKKEKNNS